MVGPRGGGRAAQDDGTISAEHGVGVATARFLHLTRSGEEIAAMRAIKAALDPGARSTPAPHWSNERQRRLG